MLAVGDEGVGVGGDEGVGVGGDEGVGVGGDEGGDEESEECFLSQLW